ncbi:MAG: hypothetical protein WCJ30_29720, partial [Deltaproteobacteria bacterium]
VFAVIEALASIALFGLFYAAVGAMAGSLADASRSVRATMGALVPLGLVFVSGTAMATIMDSSHHELPFIGLFSPLTIVVPVLDDGLRREAILAIGVFGVFAVRVAARRFATDSALPFSRRDSGAFVLAATLLHALHARLNPEVFSGSADDRWSMSLAGALITSGLTVGLAVFAILPRRAHFIAWARRASGDAITPVASSIADQGRGLVLWSLVLGVSGAAIGLASVGMPGGDGHALGVVAPAVGATVMLPMLLAAVGENSGVRHPRNATGWSMLSLLLVCLLPLIASAVFGGSGHEAQGIASLSPLYLPFAGLGRAASPVVPWISSVVAIAFFAARARAARRTLMARLARPGA